jgi:hypothetical protein
MKLGYFKSFLFLAIVAITPLHAHADGDTTGTSVSDTDGLNADKYRCRFYQTPANALHDKTSHYDYGNGSTLREAAQDVIAHCNSYLNWMWMVHGANACHNEAASDDPHVRMSCALISDLSKESNVDAGFSKYGKAPFVGTVDDLNNFMNPPKAPTVNSDQVSQLKANDPGQVPAGSASAPAPAVAPAKHSTDAN